MKLISMKNILYLALFFISIHLNGQKIDSSLDKTDLQQINLLITQFDLVLKKYYPEEKTDKLYQKYLSDLLLRKVSPNVIREKKSIDLFTTFRKSVTFKKVWKNKSKDEKVLYRINYKGAFFDYLIKNMPNKKVLEAFELFRKEENLDLSPYILVAALQTDLTEKDYTTETVKTCIAIMFYYDIILQYSTN